MSQLVISRVAEVLPKQGLHKLSWLLAAPRGLPATEVNSARTCSKFLPFVIQKHCKRKIKTSRIFFSWNDNSKHVIEDINGEKVSPKRWTELKCNIAQTEPTHAQCSWQESCFFSCKNNPRKRPKPSKLIPDSIKLDCCVEVPFKCFPSGWSEGSLPAPGHSVNVKQHFKIKF